MALLALPRVAKDLGRDKRRRHAGLEELLKHGGGLSGGRVALACASRLDGVAEIAR